ncbi:MAG TPA: hypothetical protein VGB97_01815 [Candidatus Paceibacterota bacterium]|jgi:hypothetical protein
MELRIIENFKELNLPYAHFYSTRIDVLQELRADVGNLPTVGEAYAYAQASTLPGLIYPAQAFEFFCEYKGPDRRKIMEHMDLAYGPRLDPDQAFTHPPYGWEPRNIYIGLDTWIRKRVPPAPTSGIERRVYGIDDRRELGHDFVAMLRGVWAH